MSSHADTILPLLALETQSQREFIRRHDGKANKARELKFNEIAHKAGKWDHSAPTFIPEHSELWNPDEGSFETIPLTSDFIWEAFESEQYHSNKDLRDILKMIFARKFVVAGGCVCDLLCRRGINDIDMFAPGMTEKEAEKQFSDLEEDLKKWVETEKQFSGLEKELKRWIGVGIGSIATYRTNNCITIHMTKGWAKFEVQLIMRNYRTVDEIIYGFDIAPSAVAWDGNAVYATIAARYAYYAGVFVPDVTRRRLTFETRIVKYTMRKSFAVVLPHLDTDGFEETKVLKLPFLKVNITDKKIGKSHICWNIHRIHPEMVGKDRQKVKEELAMLGGSSDYNAIPYAKPKEIREFNIIKLALGSDFLVWHEVEGKLVPVMPETQKLPKIIFEMLRPDTKRNYYGAPSVRTVGKLLKVFQKTGVPLVHVMESAIMGEITEAAETQLKDLSDALIEHMKTVPPPVWKEVTDGTDLITGFKMDPTSCEEWYGEHHKEHELPDLDSWLNEKRLLLEHTGKAAVAPKASATTRKITVSCPSEWLISENEWEVVNAEEKEPGKTCLILGAPGGVSSRVYMLDDEVRIVLENAQ